MKKTATKKVNGLKVDAKKAKRMAKGEMEVDDVMEKPLGQSPMPEAGRVTNRPDLEESLGRGVFGMVGRKI